MKRNFQIKAVLMWTINDFPVYVMVFYWSMHGKIACSYYMKNNKAFTMTNGDKKSFFIFIGGSYQQITSTGRTFLLVDLKGVLHRCYYRVKNYMMWCRRMMTLCLVFNLISRSFMVLV